ncbi:hypothetical protein H5410_047704 [Solanum commersonii]|uniref:Uncharacterized protein n=1 Tax=Solanum commersonii TaxID=4109 RepID=A0A9J5XJG3_SOLCO|nr:hypothetical protein H5410_047704 [Solanum commersonii]
MKSRDRRVLGDDPEDNGENYISGGIQKIYRKRRRKMIVQSERGFRLMGSLWNISYGLTTREKLYKTPSR